MAKSGSCRQKTSRTLTAHFSRAQPRATLALAFSFVEQEKQARFFLIDSGGFATQLSLNTAKAVTKVHNEEEWHVKGLNGEVNKVYNADKATLVFAHLRQPTEGVLVLDLKGISDNVGVEIGGVLGFTTLRFLDVKVDYRDGLVWMDYQGPKWLVH